MTHLKTALRQLRLSGLAESLDVRLQEAAANRLGHEEFLELIFIRPDTAANSRSVI